MSFWMGMANALKDKKDQDFKRELVNQEFLEKRRSSLLEATRRMQESRAEAANEFGPTVSAFQGFLSEAVDTPEVRKLREAAAADPRAAKTLMERVEEIESRTGSKIDPNLFAVNVEIYGLDGFDYEDTLSFGTVTEDLLGASSMDDLDKVELGLMGAGAGRPNVGVRVNPVLARPEDTKLQEDQRKLYDQEMANFLQARMDSLEASGASPTELSTLQAMIRGLDKEDVRAMADSRYGSQVMASLNERFADNPSWVGSELNPFLPRIARTEAPAETPMVGEVVDGYKFLGGDPSKASSWELVP